MKQPNEFSLAALVAEDGMDVRAGLPEELRRNLEQLNASRKRSERAKAMRERLEGLISRIAAYEAQIEELQKELEDAIREYAEVTTSAPAA